MAKVATAAVDQRGVNCSQSDAELTALIQESLVVATLTEGHQRCGLAPIFIADWSGATGTADGPLLPS
jgi:hypothetical protein